MSFVSQELIDQFNRAAALARKGRLEDSLEAWNALLEPRERPARAGLVTGHFLGVACMRRAWVLMDLGRYADARARLEEPIMRALLSQLGTEDLYEYYYSYGNTLGNLGDIPAMDEAFTRALGLAAEELGDLGRCLRTWHFLLTHALSASAWDYLLQEAPRAMIFARNTGAAALLREADTALETARAASLQREAAAVS